MRIFLAFFLAFSSWPVDKYAPSIAKFTSVHPDGVGRCTAFSVQPTVWVTANHCLGDGATINGEEATVVFQTAHLTVLIGPKAPTLGLGEKAKPGDAQLALGYGYGAPRLLLSEGLAMGEMPLPDGSEMASFLSVRTYEGMSGAPILSRKGKVVNVVLGGIGAEGSEFTYGVTHEELHAVFEGAKRAR